MSAPPPHIAPPQDPAFTREPVMVDGFPAFAPALAHANDGFAADSHDFLDTAQDRSFWFRERNRLIGWLARRYGPGAAAGAGIELGCGTGYVLSALREACPGLRFHGTELHVSGLRGARARHGGGVALLQVDARDIPFGAVFDLVAAFDVLEHIAEDEAVLAEAWRVMRPGGLLLLSVPQHPWLWSKADEIAHHKRRYRRGELSAKVRAAGFEVLRDTSFVSSLLPLMALQRLTAGRRDADYDGKADMLLPGWLDRLLGAALALERALIRMGVSFPAGGSRVIAARKPAGGAPT